MAARSPATVTHSEFVGQGAARLPAGSGLGLRVDEGKIKRYLEDEFHA
ncbi:MAG: hypothetical protein QF734_08045 [Arenicellales bacterium]|jgi:hypothetical protein|nr:hypothetical protein [Arenicellales bacterium]MDP7119995.1 hypothetical protein [Arenicellales bacterium]MDP7193234.1 hypothetical protein [Arenicellales bacterium]MDP7491212.1 hypothetical protein [Arenicellales bacterium]MDP7563708.1 hypothetical protein [Arenicellales bacterium]